MSLQRARVEQIMEELAKEQLLDGRIPSSHELATKFNELLQGLDPTLPRMQLRLQGYRTRFNRTAYNTTVEELVADMRLLFDESVGTAIRILKGVNADDVQSRSLGYQTAIVDDLLEDLLLNEPGAAGYFFGVFDSFNDLSKVNLQQTTCDVDLETGAARLPVAGGVNRLSLAFMINRARARLSFDQPDAIVSSNLVPGSRFGFIFDDIIGSVWQEEVLARTSDPLTAEFQIPIALLPAQDPQEIERRAHASEAQIDLVENAARYISRIDIDPLTETEMAVQVLHSIDGQNWTLIPNHPPQVLLKDKRVSLRFESTLVKYLKLNLTTGPDSEVQIGGGPSHWTYHYGLRSLAVYNSGYAASAELISRTLAPEEVTDTPLGKLALNVDEVVPPGTDIEYYVAQASADPSWIRVSSGLRDQAVAPAIVDFAGALLSPRTENGLRVQVTPPQHSQRNGITFYEVGLTVDSDYIRRSSRLYRGINAWKKKVNYVESTHVAKQNFVVFTLSDNKQSLYLEIEDERIASPSASVAGSTTTVFTRHSIFRDESVPVIPEGNVPKENPNYSIRRLIRVRKSGGAAGTGNIEGGNIGDTNLPPGRARLTIASAGFTATLAVDQLIYVEPTPGTGRFYKVISFSTVGSNEEIILEDESQNLTDATGVTWSINSEDITTSIVDAIQNRIVLNETQSLETGDELVVSYRRPLGPEHELVTSSIVVKGGTAGSTVFQLGTDYVVDQQSKAIARIPEGGIRPQTDQITVRVDFQYRTLDPDLDTYTAFLMVESDEAIKIDLGAAFGVDEVAGERVFIEDGIKVYDLTNETVLPALPKGWRQVTVRSKPLVSSSGAVDTNSAIYKVINKVDVNGQSVFQPTGLFFTRMSAFPESMRETNIFGLQTGTLKDDREKYAVDGTDVVINWDPTEVPDTIYPVVDQTGGFSLLAYEEFEMLYRYHADDPGDPEVLFKAVLQRSQGTDKTVTPELRSYNLRFSF
jgi:hypothetical protein